jgi:hypothetical protein
MLTSSSQNLSTLRGGQTPSTVLGTVARDPFNDHKLSIRYTRSFQVDTFDVVSEAGITDNATERYDWDHAFPPTPPAPVKSESSVRMDPLRSSRPARTHSMYSKNGDTWYEHRDALSSAGLVDDPVPLPLRIPARKSSLSNGGLGDL